MCPLRVNSSAGAATLLLCQLLARLALFVGLGAAVAGHAVTTLLPLGSPMGFQRYGLEGFGQAVEPGLWQFVVHGDLQGEPLSLCDRSVLAACCAALISLCQALAALMLL